MSDAIVHQFGAISGHLDDMQRGIQGAQQFHEACDRALLLLHNSGAFLGEAAGRIDVLRQQHSQKTGELIDRLHAIHQAAGQQQIETAVLDNRLAGGI